jgi:peptidoglycan/LPS O-acetylase OafA/YrhL
VPPIPSGKRLAGLDHLRALAIILVFLYHYRIFGDAPLVTTLGSFGWTGVDLFFVLSGYLIGGQLLGRLAAGKPISYGEFYFKRFLRIIPAYLVVLILYFTIPAFTERSQLPPLWKFLTFTQNFGLDLSSRAAFSHAWSLCIEEQFYLLLPLFVIILAAFHLIKKGGWLIHALVLMGLGLRLYDWENYVVSAGDQSWIEFYRYIYYPSYNRLDGLLAGLSLAALLHFQPFFWQRLTRYGNILLLAGIGLITAAGFFCAGFVTFNTALLGFPLISLAYGIMVLAALSPSCILFRYSSWATRWIATLSYSIYLTHKQMIHLTHTFLSSHGIDNDSYTSFWISALAALIGGLILHFSVERPFLRLRDALLAKKRPFVKKI